VQLTIFLATIICFADGLSATDDFYLIQNPKLAKYYFNLIDKSLEIIYNIIMNKTRQKKSLLIAIFFTLSCVALFFLFSGCDEVRVQGLYINGKPESVGVLQSIELKAVFEPESATDTQISWRTSTPDIIDLIVDGNSAIVTAKSIGKAIVIATAKDGNFVDTAIFDVVSSPVKISFVGADENNVIERTYCADEQTVVATSKVKDLVYSYLYTKQGGEATKIAPTDAGTYTVVATINSPYYTGSATCTLVVKPAEIYLKADDQSKFYGEQDGTLTKTITKGKIYGEETMIGSLKRQQGETVGNYAITQDVNFVVLDENLEISQNYVVLFQPGVFTIKPLNKE